MCYNLNMNKTSGHNKKQTTNSPVVITVFIVSTMLVIACVASVVMLNRDVAMLRAETDYLNKQSLQFNGRTNNLEGCWKNQDFECPENKYFDASQFMKD